MLARKKLNWVDLQGKGLFSRIPIERLSDLVVVMVPACLPW